MTKKQRLINTLERTGKDLMHTAAKGINAGKGNLDEHLANLERGAGILKTRLDLIVFIGQKRVKRLKKVKKVDVLAGVIILLAFLGLGIVANAGDRVITLSSGRLNVNDSEEAGYFSIGDDAGVVLMVHPGQIPATQLNELVGAKVRLYIEVLDRIKVEGK